MGEEKEKKKKKKKDKKEKSPPPPVEEPTEEENKTSSKKKSSKRASAAKFSGPLSMFNERQLQDFKNGFNYMDQDKDGIISKSDLFRTYDIIGKLAADAELESLLGESDNPITFTQMLTMFAGKMEGKADDDDVIVDALKAFDDGNGEIDTEQFALMMKGKGCPLTQKEIDEIFPEIPRVEVNPFPGCPKNISLKGVIEMLVAPQEEESEYETDNEVAA